MYCRGLVLRAGGVLRQGVLQRPLDGVGYWRRGCLDGVGVGGIVPRHTGTHYNVCLIVIQYCDADADDDG